ncbi:type III secretion system translocon subunit SctE [Escherichia coli]|uniref:type III secretion system translocon subunit SctE n=1 Tax=Escherichia coli TaxID=562 RepID=UPI001D14F5A8|nr:type III secretion system translocon subunit SctE [Escherichia coli]EIG1887013.1 type III secretion system translocon subunit SctE [Escherichia coli]HEI2790248.1 type III secretion system translocon subunit SctE [Escherichia coli]HEI3621586.1 type III secretion system translocon subunit SctE [Escherichia coli]HEI3671898.1 type III secretion system translocon subunit SctE [Escherichia coli]HEI4217044.1 type III secretion system translocon subunit SctE [Escherichia coli]
MDIIGQVVQPIILEQTNQESVTQHQAGGGVGDVDLKKQTGQAKRLGNAELKNHPQLNSVKSALQTLQPNQLLNLLNSTINTINGNTPRSNLNNQEIPQLKSPVSNESVMTESDSESKLDASARATALLGRVMQLMNETSMSSLLLQLQHIDSMMDGAVNAYSEMAALLEQQGTQWASDADALKVAQQEADGLARDVSKALSSLDDAQRKLAALEAEAAREEPISEELQGKINIARTAVTSAQAELNQVTNAYDNFVNKTLMSAINAEKNSRSELETTQAKSQKMVESFNLQQQNIIEQRRKEIDSQSKTLVFLIALMAQLIDKSSSDDLQASAELKQKLAEAAAKDAEKKAKEYEEEVRKASDMQKTMGCIGKVVGWVVTAVSFTAAAFTGGASLAVAGVMLALTIGDEIARAATGHSFMADAMQPLMDVIVKPLMEMIGKIFSSILQSVGIDKDSADMVGQIFGAIAAAAVLVAGVMVAGSVMSKVFGLVMKNLQRLMSSTVSLVVKRFSQGFGRLFGADELQMAKVSNYSQTAVVGLSVVNTSCQSAIGVIAAGMMLDASKIRAEMMKNVALQNLLNQMMTRVIDNFAYRMEIVSEIVRNISVIAEKQAQAGKYVTRQMSTIAG